MKILPFEPENKHWRRQFIQLPFRLYQDDPNWVPPLMMDMRLAFDRRRHGFYRHGDVQCYLAVEGNQAVGRLMMLHDRASQAGDSSKTARFYYFESEENPEIAQQLFAAGADWARKRGLQKIFGPKGMTPLDGLGMLVRGFEYSPAFGMPYNPPYYPGLLMECGFSQVREAESGYLDPAQFVLPEKVHRAAELIRKRKGFRVLKLSSRKDLRNAVHLLGDMYNAALIGTEGNTPLSEQDLQSMTNGLLWIAQPELIKLIFKEDQPVGFLLAYPDIAKALRATRGRVFPFGWVRILWEKHHSKQIDINGAGIAAKYRGLAATALLFSEMYQSVTASGQFSHGEVIQIGTENERMRAELRGMGINFYKSHALFEMEI
jgi:hypothetical protein